MRIQVLNLFKKRKKYSSIAVFGMAVLLNSSMIKAQQADPIIQSELEKLVNEDKLLNEDISSWKISSEHKSSLSGIHHIYFNQAYNGIEIKGTESSIHKMPSGEILVKHNSFVREMARHIRNAGSPTISAEDAIQAVVR